jgi:hypothetical protein
MDEPNTTQEAQKESPRESSDDEPDNKRKEVSGAIAGI